MKNDPYGLLSSGLPPEMAARARGLTRQQAVAEAMLEQSQSPMDINRMAGGYVVPVSPFEGLAKLGKAYFGRKSLEDAEAKSLALGSEYQNLTAQEVAKYAQRKAGTPESTIPAAPYEAPIGAEDSQAQTGAPVTVPAQPGDPRGAIIEAMTSRNPVLNRLGAMDQASFETDRKMKAEQEFKASESAATRTARSEDRAMMLEARAQEAALSREAREAAAREAAALRRDLASQADATRRDIAAQNVGMRQDALAAADAARQQKNTPKLPTPALKLQQEELDAIGIASSINADLGVLQKQIADGDLNLGLVSNAVNQARNYVGMSNDKSANLASFKTSIEKLRNDSLRLNKGVQTEGDAVRAMNEIMANINDPKVVAQRLAELQKINERAVTLRKNNIDVIRSNFGVDPLNTAPVTNVPPAVGSGGATGGWSIKRVP